MKRAHSDFSDLWSTEDVTLDKGLEAPEEEQIKAGWIGWNGDEVGDG